MNKKQIFAVLLALFVFAGIAAQAQSASALQNSKQMQHTCSSFGNYPMTYNPPTSEFCVINPSGGPNNIVWSATMVSSNKLVVAYEQASAAIVSPKPSYVTNVTIVPNSNVTVCDPRIINGVQQCVVINYGADGYNENGAYYVMMGLNGYKTQSS